MVVYSCSRRALELVVWGLTSIVLVQSVIAPFLPQSFSFKWDTSGLPIPVTVQCENIHIVWGRGSETGPNPVAPYYLQVYTSIYDVPIIIPAGRALTYDWQVPFPPNTLYQICMFDTNGNTGGCQATYTVVPNTTTTTPTCTNVTLPPILDIDAEVNTGPWSQYGWIEQCSDISITPKNGTPPYTLTIAPSLHPPYNITSGDMSRINWTVSLTWASPFFISLVDSAGNMWANGLLHSGEGNRAACLAGNATTVGSGLVKPVVAIGSGIGGLAFGLFVGILISFLFLRWHHRKKVQDKQGYSANPTSGTPQAMLNPSTTMGTASQYIPIPFLGAASDSRASSNPPPSSKLGRSLTSGTDPSLMSGDGRRHDSSYGSSRPLSNGSTSPGGQVYVVHHDSHASPVTIYHDNGTQVVELPPRYPSDVSSPTSERDTRSVTDSRSNGGRTDTPGSPTFLREH